MLSWKFRTGVKQLSFYMTFEAAIAGVGPGDRGDTFRFRTPAAPVLARHDHHRDPGAISPSVASERLSSVAGQRGGFTRPPAAKSFLFGSTNRSAGDSRKPPGGSDQVDLNGVRCGLPNRRGSENPTPTIVTRAIRQADGIADQSSKNNI